MTLNRRQRDAAQDAAVALTRLTDMARTDPEKAHGEADVILLNFVTALGHVDADEVVGAYRAMLATAPWWGMA